MTTNYLKQKRDHDDEIVVVPAYLSTNSANTNTTTILDLPTELIEYICCYDSLTLIDVLNLAVSHSRLKKCLFHEQNARLWKSKFIQKYGMLDNEEYEVFIDEQNTWKDEIMLRISLDKAVPSEIIQMPQKFMKFGSIPYHLYPFSQYLHSKNEGHRYYILSAIAAYCKKLPRNENYHVLYMAHQFLMYSCQVYFGYKLRNFISLPMVEQTVERGFHLLERWWCPTVIIPYRDINESLNNIAIDVCNRIYLANPVHPLFEHNNCLKQIVERGKFNLSNDLFDETSTMFILDHIRQIIFSNDQLVCDCTDDLNCYLLYHVIERRKGSVILLCVIFESVARRLGVKVGITAMSVHDNYDNFVSWSSSWPGSKHNKPTYYLVDIADRGAIWMATVIENTTVSPIRRSTGIYVLDLFWTFSQCVETIFWPRVKSRKYILDFQKLLKPDDSQLQCRSQKTLKAYDYCQCPLIRNPANPDAPNHEYEMNNIFIQWQDVFPMEPRTRGESYDPKFSIGMIIEYPNDHSSRYTTRGIVVGWKRVSSENYPTTVYFVLGKHYKKNIQIFENVIFEKFAEDRPGELQRQLNPDNYLAMNIGKFFTHFSHELCAFVPINSLAQFYPDDLSYTYAQL
ncbi:uncharacterized protein LOC132947228 isoform X2 [Metopolophium dirhodum]|uniref:uncharacterized protein LOC132947228 isoform X2 n=1 Tax=Metopolophium dirhodum TaxID=44670 RepID=UPI00298FF6C1|nr:uncharacterized protein LOC132947228 isoform X2 [Metopolophium dirhodum]